MAIPIVHPQFSVKREVLNCVQGKLSTTPWTSAKAVRVVEGFRTGDLVKAVVLSGKKAGTHMGKVAVRTSGYFNVSAAAGVVQGISHRRCSVIYRADGYSYQSKLGAPLGNELPSSRAFEVS